MKSSRISLLQSAKNTESIQGSCLDSAEATFQMLIPRHDFLKADFLGELLSLLLSFCFERRLAFQAAKSDEGLFPWAFAACKRNHDVIPHLAMLSSRAPTTSQA